MRTLKAVWKATLLREGARKDPAGMGGVAGVTLQEEPRNQRQPCLRAFEVGFVDWGFGMLGARPAWVWQGFSAFLAKVWQVGVCRVFLPMVWQAPPASLFP